MHINLLKMSSVRPSGVQLYALSLGGSSPLSGHRGVGTIHRSGPKSNPSSAPGALGGPPTSRAFLSHARRGAHSAFVGLGSNMTDQAHAGLCWVKLGPLEDFVGHDRSVHELHACVWGPGHQDSEDLLGLPDRRTSPSQPRKESIGFSSCGPSHHFIRCWAPNDVGA